MTRLDERLTELLLAEVRGMTGEQAVRRLYALGLVDRRGCERRFIRFEVDRLQREGMPRCAALETAAETCCCSYEKARHAFYDPSH